MSEQPLMGIEQEKIISLGQETQFAPNGIVSRTLPRAPNGRVVLFGFAGEWTKKLTTDAHG